MLQKTTPKKVEMASVTKNVLKIAPFPILHEIPHVIKYCPSI